MKITKSQLKQIIREELDPQYADPEYWTQRKAAMQAKAKQVDPVPRDPAHHEHPGYRFPMIADYLKFSGTSDQLAPGQEEPHFQKGKQFLKDNEEYVRRFIKELELALGDNSK